MLVRPAARHDAPVADGFALGVLTHVRGRGHGVHGRGSHDVVSSPAAAGAAVSHRAYTPLPAAATAPPHHRRTPTRRRLPVTAPPKRGGRNVTAVTVARLRQDVLFGLRAPAKRLSVVEFVVVSDWGRINAIVSCPVPRIPSENFKYLIGNERKPLIIPQTPSCFALVRGQ